MLELACFCWSPWQALLTAFQCKNFQINLCLSLGFPSLSAIGSCAVRQQGNRNGLQTEDRQSSGYTVGLGQGCGCGRRAGRRK